MKKQINLALLFLTTIVFSQTKTIENVKNFDLRNFGSITKDSLTKHYSFHTATKSSNNKQVEGVLTFYNKDLSEAKKEIFTLNGKSNIYLETQNNGSQIITAFHNNEKEITTFNIFSDKGDLMSSNEISAKKDAFGPFFYKGLETIGDYTLIFPVKNKGFLISEIVKKKRFGYTIYYLGEDKDKNWSYESPADHNNRKSACPMFANEDIVIIMEKEWGSNFDRQPTFIAIVLETKTGKELFRVSHEFETTPNFYTKATVNAKGEIILFGETYNKGNNYPDNDYNTGYFIEKYSKTGQLITKNTFNFNDLTFKTALGFKIEDKQKDFGTVYFYDIIPYEGKYYAVGEIARRDKQGFTIAKAIASQAIGGAVGGLISNNWDTKYTIDDLIILELDENLKFVKTHKLEKETNKTGLNTIVVRPYFNLKELEVNRKLDYLFNAKDNTPSQTLFYLDRKIINEKPDFRIRKAFKENDEFKSIEFSKIELNDSVTDFRVSPISKSSLLLMKYDAKKETVKLEILK